MTTKIVETTVTSAMLAAAQGGTGGGDDLLTVRCPERYDASAVTAEDIIHDGAIQVVRPTKITIYGVADNDLVQGLGSEVRATVVHTYEGRGDEPSVTIVECEDAAAVEAVEEWAASEASVTSYRTEAV